MRRMARAAAASTEPVDRLDLRGPVEPTPRLQVWIDDLLRCSPDETYVIARMSIWGRWILWIAALAYMLSHWDLTGDNHRAMIALLVAMVVANAGFHWRLLSSQPITARWFLGFCALDAVIIISASSFPNPFQSIVYLGLFPALASVAVGFSSFTFCSIWTALIAAAYVGTTLTFGSGSGLESPDTHTLVARALMMFAVAFAVNMVTGYERTGRLEALEREQALQREQIELSQRIHDTSAQSAYMIGLGIDNAIALAGEDQTELRRTLTATSELSRTAMWELRQPINMGLIYEGQELSQVLGAHARTFTAITSVPAKLVQTGEEPPLEPQVRARILSIAHNALTNAHRHSGASEVRVEIEFGRDGMCLSVTDDGVGLPEDYAERGHGFRNMRAEAERLGGVFSVEFGGPGDGTTVSCQIPYDSE